MAARVKRIELDEYRGVKAIEFYEESNPSDVLEFLRVHNIGREFVTSAQREGNNPDMTEYIRAGVQAKYPYLSTENVEAIVTGRIDVNSIPTDAVLSNHLTDTR